jgi:hypothetical protein
VIGLPWYLLAAGIVIVIVGFLLASLPESGKPQRRISRRMRDDEIIRTLHDAERMPFSSLVVVFGLLVILVSAGWRLARYFL